MVSGEVCRGARRWTLPKKVATQEGIAAVPAVAGWKPALLSGGAVVPYQASAFAA